MRLLYVSNEYPPETNFGGIGTYTKYCAEGMAALGHCVHVICRSLSGEAYSSVVSGVIVHRISGGAYPLPSQRLFYPLRKCCYRAIPSSLERLAWAGHAYKTFIKIVSPQEQFDIVECAECGGEGFYFAKNAECLLVVRLHTPWEMVRELDRIKNTIYDRCLISFIEQYTARHASYVTSPTQTLADIVRNRWHLVKPAVFPNPIPASDFPATVGSDWLYIGRIEYRKGIHLLLEAYSRLCRSCDPPLLRLIGKPYGALPDGTGYSEYIAKLINDLPPNADIEWIRGVENDSVKNYLQKSSVAVFASLWENLSYSCLEAMASGLAVIAPDCGGFPEMIANGETGLLVDPNNDIALYNAMKELLSQPNLIEKLGENARNRIKKVYDVSVVIPYIETYYKRISQSDNHE